MLRYFLNETENGNVSTDGCFIKIIALWNMERTFWGFGHDFPIFIVENVFLIDIFHTNHSIRDRARTCLFKFLGMKLCKPHYEINF